MSQAECNSLADEVHMHLTALNLGQNYLVKKLAVAPSKISSWLADPGSSSHRTASKSAVKRMADALLTAYDASNAQWKKLYGSDDPFELLGRMLASAGYTHVLGKKEDSIWDRIAMERTSATNSDGSSSAPAIKVGWLSWGNFTKNDFSGLARIITDELGRLMGLSVQPVRLDSYEDIANYVETRRVDLMAPLLLAPYRMFKFSCSSSIGVKCGLNFLGAGPALAGIVPKGLQDSQQLNASRFRINYVKGGVAQYLRPHLHGPEHPPEAHNTVSEAICAVLDEPIDPSTQAVRLFCGDQFTCRAQEIANPKKRPQLLFVDPPVKLPIVFGINRSEPQLLQIVNQTIEVMLPWIDDLFRDDRHSKELFGLTPPPKNEGGDWHI